MLETPLTSSTKYTHTQIIMIIATQHYINVLNYLMKFNLNKLINYQRLRVYFGKRFWKNYKAEKMGRKKMEPENYLRKYSKKLKL